ncbi:hypothetical protein OSB04_010635 [Centaurea solstitialis]|uniref:RING-type domain-containing protein n=1 Tax=Centaurea solstitialis TaxID=347529 RepID=A0AA38TL55_9ASTR|nr:hypothetical protein OSB04_010635 [Centaurea solstitialis]
MAVQAQYPPNALIHHRSLQEDKNQIGKPEAIDSKFLHHHQSPNEIFLENYFPGILFSNGKKCLFTGGINTGLRLAFFDHQRRSPMSTDLSVQIDQQRDEIERFQSRIRVCVGEEIRRTLAEKRQRHYLALLEAAEVSISRRLKDKDAEAEKAVWRQAELEARAVQLRTEAEAWRARAAAAEAVAAGLKAQLQQAMVVCGSGGGGGGRYCASHIEDAPPGYATAAGDNTEDAESAYIDPDRVVVASGPGCKACGKRVASVVLLPCRHLCVCSECDGVVLACPLCLSFRSSSVQVYMS